MHTRSGFCVTTNTASTESTSFIDLPASDKRGCTIGRGKALAVSEQPQSRHPGWDEQAIIQLLFIVGQNRFGVFTECLRSLFRCNSAKIQFLNSICQRRNDFR